MIKRIFITGEHGMIACAAAHYFLCDPENFELVNWAYDGDNNKDFVAAYKNESTKELDIRSERFVEKILETKPHFIIHTAAYVNTDSCELSAKECIDSNVFGTWQVIEAAKKVQARIIFIGTTATYDPSIYNGRWITEDDPQLPKTIYGTTKYDSELLVQNYCPDAFILRPCFAFGGIMDDPLLDVDKRLYFLRDTSSNITKMIYNSIYKILEKPKFTLDSGNLKDYMSVDDLGFAVYLEANRGLRGSSNISRMQPSLWASYCYMVENELRNQGIKVCDYQLLGEKDYLLNHLVDSTVFRSIGWEPKWSVLEVIQKVITQVRNNEFLFNEKAMESHK